MLSACARSRSTLRMILCAVPCSLFVLWLSVGTCYRSCPCTSRRWCGLISPQSEVYFNLALAHRLTACAARHLRWRVWGKTSSLRVFASLAGFVGLSRQTCRSLKSAIQSRRFKISECSGCPGSIARCAQWPPTPGDSTPPSRPYTFWC